MIILNEMNTKTHPSVSSPLRSGYSLLELLVAMTIFSGIFLGIWGLVGNLQFSQNKIVVSNDFYDESRLLMERIVQMVRNNTIDYDRYYCDRNTQCAGKYEEAFYDDKSGKERNLGDGDTAFDDLTGKPLYLINAERTVRTAITTAPNDILSTDVDFQVGALVVQTQVGKDTDNDGKIDEWVSTVSDCEDIETGSETEPELFCKRAHGWTSIAPDQVQVTTFALTISPNKDPYLAFKDPNVQIQPFVRIGMTTQMRNATKYGFTENESPEIFLQTAASSRVFGNTR